MAGTWERFYLATRALVGPGPIKSRLVGAYEANLEDLSLEELPESVRPVFSQLATELHKVCPLGEESPVWATVRKMSDQDADRCAETIVDLYATVTRLNPSI